MRRTLSQPAPVNPKGVLNPDPRPVADRPDKVPVRHPPRDALVIFIAECVPVAESEPVTIVVAASVAVVEPESVAGTRSGKLVERWVSQFLWRTKR